MNRNQRFQFVIALVLCLLTTGTFCFAQTTTQITGAGSSFVNPIMTHWASDFRQKHPNVEVNYQSVGSGAGIQQVKNGLVDFGASDVALSDEQLKEMPALIQVPESAGPVCITYNLADISKPIRLSGEALAGIFLGTITNWNDPAIVKTNAGLSLPKVPIMVVHRSDGSGTTGIFSTYLSAISSDWKSRVGQGISLRWPVGMGAKGSEGVTGMVKQMPGGIGYVELNYAEENHLPIVEMENQAGKFVAPTSASASAAIDAFQVELAKDVRTPIVNAPASAPKAYPITGLTFLLIPKVGREAGKHQATSDFVEYVITAGQSIATQLHYAPLPSSIAKLDRELLKQIQTSYQAQK